jgi:hypothetical protein
MIHGDDDLFDRDPVVVVAVAGTARGNERALQSNVDHYH